MIRVPFTRSTNPRVKPKVLPSSIARFVSLTPFTFRAKQVCELDFIAIDNTLYVAADQAAYEARHGKLWAKAVSVTMWTSV